MKRNLTILIGIFIIAVAALVVILIWPSNKAMAPTTGGQATTTPNEGSNTVSIKDLITAEFPTKNARISSPLTVTGTARGTWYFEASFPVEVLDASSKTIAQAPAQAQSDWMTTDFVPFKATLTFPKQPAGSKGTVVLHKDNPSGDPARDQSISIPVTF